MSSQHRNLKLLVAAVVAGLGRLASAQQAEPASSTSHNNLLVAINKSTILENAVGIKRVSVGNPRVAEAVAVTRNEVLVNGKSAGETSIVLWDVTGKRSIYDLHVGKDASAVDVVRAEMDAELPGQDVKFEISEGNVYLRGTVKDANSAARAAALAGTLGKVVNLLRVQVPETEPQIMLRVRFLNINRSAAAQYGFNLFSLGATNTIGGTSTNQFGRQPSFTQTPGSPTIFSFSDYLNIFLLRRDIGLSGAIQALQAKQILEILAEPNLLTVSGRPANFLAGGEFPFPTLQGGGSGVGQITVQFREFGIRINFLPIITPRGTIRLAVQPEVSALDYSAALTVSGYTIPGLSTRRVQTEVELETGQSFVIAGLLDNRVTESLNKIPGLANLPVLGKLFQSKSVQKNNSELMVLVTPELVKPINAQTPLPGIQMDKPFMRDGSTKVPANPTEAPGKLPSVETLPIELLDPSAGNPQSPPADSGAKNPLGDKPASNAIANAANPFGGANGAAPSPQPGKF